MLIEIEIDSLRTAYANIDNTIEILAQERYAGVHSSIKFLEKLKADISEGYANNIETLDADYWRVIPEAEKYAIHRDGRIQNINTGDLLVPFKCEFSGGAGKMDAVIIHRDGQNVTYAVQGLLDRLWSS